MSNAYFDWPAKAAEDRFVRFTTVRAADANNALDLVSAGFEKLPSAAAIAGGTVNYAVDTGAADAYAITVSPQVVAYADGQTFQFRASHANTAASTLNVNLLGAKGLKSYNGSALVVSDIVVGQVVQCTYDATNDYFRMSNFNVSTAYLDPDNLSDASTPTTGTVESLMVKQSGNFRRIKLSALVSWAISATVLLASGVSAVARSISDVFLDRVSVFDYMTAAQIADVRARTLTLDVRAAVQACIDANPSKPIYFPHGAYKFVGGVLCSTDGQVLYALGMGGVWGKAAVEFVQFTANVKTVEFKSPTADASGTTLNNVGIRGILFRIDTSIYATETTGISVQMTHCDRYILSFFGVRDSARGVVCQGGSDGKLSHFELSAALSGDLSATVGNALLNFERFTWNAGASAQECFTVNVSHYNIAGGLIRYAAVAITSQDGLSFHGGHIGSGKRAIIYIRPIATGAYVSGVSFMGTYFDQVLANWSDNGVVIPDDGFGTGTYVGDVHFHGCSWNGGPGNAGSPVLVRRGAMGAVKINGGTIQSSTLAPAIDFQPVTNTSAELHVNGVTFMGNGNAASSISDVKAVAGSALVYVNNVHRGTLYRCLEMSGSWSFFHVKGNVNKTALPDITNSATSLSEGEIAENISAYSGATANSWRGMNQMAAKATPVDADVVSLWDSAAGMVRKALTIANLATALLNGRAIGATSQSTGKFTTLETTGNVAFGAAVATPQTQSLLIQRTNFTGNGAGVAVGQAISITAGSTVVTSFRGYQTFLGTQAAAFTVADMQHYMAGRGTIGAGSAITNQTGFYADSTLTGATNNYGFYGALGAASGVWNFYSGGSAANYFGGATTFGTTFGYGTLAGVGGTVTQLTNRTTAVTLNKSCGEITLFSAAGSATAASFTVNNSVVAATDRIIPNVKSGTNKYLAMITAIGAGTFEITFWTTGGTATDSPVIGFTIIKSTNA